jgi:phosphonoacetaldehyde hydrolase
MTMERVTTIRLAVFDWAGTAVDFGSCAPANAFIEAFRDAGVPVSAIEARAPMGLAKKEHLRTMLAESALAARWQKAKGSHATEADVERLYQAVTPRQIEAAGRLGAPVPGLLDCVAELRRAGLKITGTTGYFRAAAEAAAATAARWGYVPDATICADEVPSGRPAPWMLFRVMEATGCYPGWSVVKIGDTPVDMGEGRNAGAWCVGVLDSSNGIGLTESEFAELSLAEKVARRGAVSRRLMEAGAHCTVNSLSELPALVADLNRRLECGERP